MAMPGDMKFSGSIRFCGRLHRVPVGSAVSVLKISLDLFLPLQATMFVIVEAHYDISWLSCEDVLNEALTVDETIIHGMK